MKSWSYGINSLYRHTSINLIQAPFWVFWLETFMDHLCHYMPAIPFPSIGRVVDDGENYNWAEWYGDLHQAFHVVIHDPIQDWLWAKQKEHHIQIDYDILRGLFYEEDRAWWDECELTHNLSD